MHWVTKYSHISSCIGESPLLTLLSPPLVDHVQQRAGDHRGQGGEEDQDGVRPCRWEEAPHLHGRPQHAGQGHLRLSASAGTDQAVDRLRVLVRPTAADHEADQGHVSPRCHGSSGRRPDGHIATAAEQVQPHQHDLPSGKQQYSGTPLS